MEKPQDGVTMAVPFFMVADMETSLRFYIDGLGFELKNTWTPRGRIEWCWLQIGTAAIMLQEHAKDGPHATEKKGGSISTCFQCKDAIGLYHSFREKGIEAREPFVGNNLWVTIVKDPDGFTLDFESETDVPEETKYADWIKE